MSTDTSPLLAASLVQPSGPQPSSSPLKTGVLKWWQLLFIGVGYVISGDYAGWQFGLLQGGWGGAVIAVAFCAVMYICLVLCLAELSTSLRASAFGIVKHSLGELPAIAASFCVALEYLSITATIAIFIGYYVAQLTDPALNSFVPLMPFCMCSNGASCSLLLWVVPPALYVVFGAVHMYGVGEATTLTAVLTAIALCGVVVFVGGAAPFFDVANLSVAACDPESTDVCDSYFPSGWRGVWNAIPYGTWFFLAIEGLPFAVDEAVEPQKSIPRALFGSLAILITTATCMVVIAPASSSAFFVAHTQAPLSEIMTLLYGPKHALTIVIATTGLIGLVASFSGAFYAYSRAVRIKEDIYIRTDRGMVVFHARASRVDAFFHGGYERAKHAALGHHCAWHRRPQHILHRHGPLHYVFLLVTDAWVCSSARVTCWCWSWHLARPSRTSCSSSLSL